jgi:hypothetical protein
VFRIYQVLSCAFGSIAILFLALACLVTPPVAHAQNPNPYGYGLGCQNCIAACRQDGNTSSSPPCMDTTQSPPAYPKCKLPDPGTNDSTCQAACQCGLFTPQPPAAPYCICNIPN